MPPKPPGSAYPSWLPALLGCLTAVGPAATDMYLPAFPAVEASFGTAPGTAQITLAAWFAGLAVGQIAQGTLSDRFGRKRPLVIGMAVFALASAGCALAPSLLLLSVFRAVAAVGASAGTVIPRAVVRDLATGHQAAVLMSRLLLVMGVAPILAPSVGGAVLLVAHWRVIFWILAACGALACLVVWRVLPDTLPPERRLRLSAIEQVRRYALIVRDRVFLTHALMGGFVSFGLFAYIAGSSPVFIAGFGLSPSHYALIFGLCAIGLVAGSQVNARLLPRFGLSRLLRIPAGLYLLATTVLTGLAFAGVHVLAAVVAPLWVALLAMGFLNPNSAVGALARHGTHAGSASALLGMWQFAMGAVSGLAVGAFTDGTPRGMAAVMLAGAAGCVIADLCRPRP